MKGITQNFDDLTDSKVLFEAKPFPFAVWFIYIILALIVTATLWAYFSDIDVVVKSEGVVRPLNNISTLTAKSSGKVTKIGAQNGDTISKGDIVYVLDHDALSIQKKSTTEQLNHLIYERDMTQKWIDSIHQDSNLFDIEKETDYYQEYEKYLMDATQIKDSIASYQSKIDDLNEKISGYNTLLESIDSNKNLFLTTDAYYHQYLDYTYQCQTLNEQLDFAKESHEKASSLYKSGAISLEEYNQSTYTLDQAQTAYDKYINESILSYKSQLRTAESTLIDAKMSLSKLMPEKQTLSDSSYFKTEKLIALNQALKDTNQQIESYQSTLENIDINIDNASIKSPIDGILNLNQTYAVGDFISNNSLLGTVIPKENTAFKIQLYVPNKDISQVNVGNKVKFQFHALPYKEYGSLEGIITHINADSTVNQSGISYYLVEASVDNQPLYDYNHKEEHIKVGMTLDAQVITRRKKVLYYLLEKLNFRQS